MKNKTKDPKPKIAIQSLLRPALTPVCANKDYHEYVATIECIDKLIRTTGIENRIVEITVQKYSSFNLTVKQLSKKAEQAIKAFRTETLRFLLGQNSFRELSIELSKSDLLADFCLARSLEGIKGVSKSTLDRNSKLFSELELGDIHQQVTKGLIQNDNNILAQGLDCKTQYVDSTCIEANIHHPTDWVCLKDYCMSVLNAIQVIRKHGMLNRLPQTIPEFKTELNQLCIKMTHARRTKDAESRRKRVLRDLKEFTITVGKHGQKHLAKLAECWHESDLSLKQKEFISERLKDLLALESRIIKQAHERIIGGRKVKNKDKILSIYDLDIEVLKRGKAGKEVEFGNKFFISENEEGYILDFSLDKGNPDDRALLEDSLNRQEESGLKKPESISADRGFYGINFSKKLAKRQITDNSCPKSVEQLKNKMACLEFVRQQKRRASTEARIGILKSKFSLSSLRSKGFENRSRSCNWAALSHNLWIISKQILSQQRQEQAA